MRARDKVFGFMSRYSIYVILTALILINAFFNENFWSWQNISNVSRQISIVTIIAMAETILIISGMIDLAAGAVLALAGVLSVASYKANGSLLLALAVGAAVGVVCNALSGLAVVRFKTPPFIATLAMQTAARGAVLLYCGGQNIYQIGNYKVLGQGYVGPLPLYVIIVAAVIILFWSVRRNTYAARKAAAAAGMDAADVAGAGWSGTMVSVVVIVFVVLSVVLVTTLGKEYDGLIPTPVVFMLVVVAFTWYLLRHTRFGRHLYAVGGNEDAARASGVSIGWTKFKAYAVSGVFVGLAGVLYMSRNNAGLPNAGAGLEFEAMTAAIIGGTSFSGGVGTAMGTLAGGFIMGFLNNGMNLFGVQAYAQQVVRGVIIVLAVIWDVASKNYRSPSVKRAVPQAAEPAAPEKTL